MERVSPSSPSSPRTHSSVEIQFAHMRLLKSVLVAIVAAAVSAVALIGALILVPVGVAAFDSYTAGRSFEGGIDGGGVSLNVGVLLLIIVAAGAAGFFWQWRRGRPALI